MKKENIKVSWEIRATLEKKMSVEEEEEGLYLYPWFCPARGALVYNLLNWQIKRFIDELAPSHSSKGGLMVERADHAAWDDNFPASEKSTWPFLSPCGHAKKHD